MLWCIPSTKWQQVYRWPEYILAIYRLNWCVCLKWSHHDAERKLDNGISFSPYLLSYGISNGRYVTWSSPLTKKEEFNLIIASMTMLWQLVVASMVPFLSLFISPSYLTDFANFLAKLLGNYCSSHYKEQFKTTKKGNFPSGAKDSL